LSRSSIFGAFFVKKAKLHLNGKSNSIFWHSLLVGFNLDAGSG